MHRVALAAASSWLVCDVTQAPYGAIGDGVVNDTLAIRSALAECDEVVLPFGRSFLSGPQNLTSNQLFRVDGTLLASTEKQDYALIAPLMGYGWSVTSAMV
jgi:polygalacturonase